MAGENRDWGYTRILGALSSLGYNLARGTVANILKRHGIEPAPERSRKTTWKEFVTQHWDMIVAADFFTVEVWTASGLQRFVVLFFMELSTRRVEIGGISAAANGLWMNQIARNLTDSVDGLLTGNRYLIHDRDPVGSNYSNALESQASEENTGWKKSYQVAGLLSSVTGLINQELLLQVEYLAAENRGLRAHAPTRLRLQGHEDARDRTVRRRRACVRVPPGRNRCRWVACHHPALGHANSASPSCPVCAA